MPQKISQGVLHIISDLSDQELKAAVAQPQVGEAFVDIAAIGDFDQALNIAQKVQNFFRDSRHLLEPVVLGPIADQQVDLIKRAGTIRTTEQTFDAYCAHKTELRTWRENLRQPPPQAETHRGI